MNPKIWDRHEIVNTEKTVESQRGGSIDSRILIRMRASLGCVAQSGNVIPLFHTPLIPVDWVADVSVRYD